MPPFTPIVALYGVPTIPFGSVLSVSVSPAGAIVIDSGPLTVCIGLLESVAFTVSAEVPAVVGVPLTVHPLIVSPAGSVPAVTAQA